MTVSGTDTAYSVTVTDDIEKERDCEPEDEITSNGTIAQGTLDGVDEDVYDVTGTIRRISVLPGSSVVFNHDI